MAKQARLELTWIGKENRSKLEPRVLIEDSGKSYHAARRVSDNDLFDNRLIFGDNLLALKALEQEFSGKVKCIYIDPPFNTGEMFEHYDDGVEHSLWLSQMRDRLECLHELLAPEGTLFVHIDDNELGYLLTVLDGVFRRPNRLYVISFKQGAATGHKAIMFWFSLNWRVSPRDLHTYRRLKFAFLEAWGNAPNGGEWGGVGSAPLTIRRTPGRLPPTPTPCSR